MRILESVTILILGGFLLPLAVSAAEAEAELRPFLQEFCYRCHAEQKQESELRLDTLTLPRSLPEGQQQRKEHEVWAQVAEAIQRGDMPPESAPQPSESQRARAASQLDRWLVAVAEPPPIGLRRLNRVEYENTVHDLLGIDVPLREMLPEDSAVQGFDNVADALAISSVLLERYLEAADAAFEAVIRRIEPLPIATRRSMAMDEAENKKSVEGNKGGVIARHNSFIKVRSGWPPTRFDSARPIEDGLYHIRIAAWPHEPGNRTLAMAVFNGSFFSGAETEPLGIHDVTGTADEPRILELTAKMRDGAYITVEPRIFPPHARGSEEPQPGVAIKWIEIEGPLDQSWPSESQKRLLGDLPMIQDKPFWMRNRKGVHLHAVDSPRPTADAERILHEFIPRAFRRPASKEQMEPFVALAHRQLEEGASFEEAIRVGITAVLCSPQFLLLNRQAEVDDYTLASRLSYFLWSSMPDETLMELAGQGTLSDLEVLHAQVDRMIDDPRIEAFTDNFTGQWLDLRDIEFTTPDKKLYPEFDELLQFSMLGETRGFFAHLLKHDLPVSNFIDSDFSVLNERLARHYGIQGIRGHEAFRVVALPEDSIRGGILTHASLLKVTANGTTTSPVLRGVWVLENLLGQPVPPPPAGIPAVEPDTRGATTVREQMSKHQSLETCARCHTRIDPPGFALESFDAIGGYRQRYRCWGEGDKVPGQKYRAGLPVEPGDRLGPGREFDDFVGFRQLLLDQSEQVARCLAEKLIVYAAGRRITPHDRQAIERMLEQARDSQHGLRSMIHAVVDSEPFHRR